MIYDDRDGDDGRAHGAHGGGGDGADDDANHLIVKDQRKHIKMCPTRYTS
jgi:hypothetical protein